jgi:hypothetical protein
MSVIVLKKKDFSFLLESKIESDILSDLRDNYSVKHESIHLDLEKEVIERILDFLGDELTRNGLDENDEPNDFGIRIENLIDKFSRAVYE